MHRILVAFAAAAWLAGPATAGDIADRASQAEALAKDGKYLEAIGALDEASAALWSAAPLTFRKTLWVAEPPGGFGAYNPREGVAFDSGAAMIAYAEPVGFGWAKSGDLWKTDIAADFFVKTKDGKVLGDQKDFQQIKLTSRIKNREFMVHFTYTFNGIPAGEYVVDTTLRDNVSGKSGTFSLPFTIN